jgi:hypothetical protein
METNNNERRFEVIEGDRARLEAEIVEDLFLGRYDPAKAALLRPRGCFSSGSNTIEEHPEEEPALAQHEAHLYSVGSDGVIRFTEEGLKELRPYLGQAGIDIRTIRTYADYLEARRHASPYFMGWLAQRARNGGPMTLERQALVAALEADDETFDRFLRRLDARKNVKIVTPRIPVGPEAPE